MPKRPASRRAEESVFFDVLYDDGTQNSNRKVLAAEVEGLDGDDDAIKSYFEAQDRKIAEMSGKPRGPIKTVTRSKRR